MNRLPLLIFDKPSGVSTHAVERGGGGTSGDAFAEALARFAGIPLRVVHRLDKGTSGALALALDREAAAAAADAFASGRAYKRYLFVTDRPGDRLEFECASPIDGNDARTRLRRLRADGRFSLWEAKPSTGRTHQIRLHAQASGLPILGDDEYGGSPFARLMLHAEELELELGGERVAGRSEAPLLFAELSLLARPRLARWLAARDRRERWMRSRAEAARASSDPRAADTDVWRTVHDDGGELRSERLGAVEWLGWFAELPPNEADWRDIRDFLRLSGREEWILQHRIDRGGGGAPGAGVWTSPELPERWTGRENGVAYEFRRGQGLSSGLFLDQRANRLWTLANAREARVLNLFSYTSGFSLCAALGGAKQTVSSDLSRPFLEWSKRNFELNGVAPERPAHEFRAMDSRELLKWAARKGLSFDLVICDPPSFSRSEKGVFRVESGMSELVEGARRVLAPGGRALISTNFEGWDQERFESALGPGLRLEPAFPSEWDFEGPRESRQMKCAFVVAQ